ncbi:hypothetical protein EJ02DRAFT_484223 [Clathrospora elynae]|uniref:N-acetyltransferase domain-containing protein n=1 Tax=Clathrospora elynae TaxID=706981 RepID=A0A6A5S6R3_9PLEO|nr:hypothetical protein EJ02DRAFT_484223 [Clathrospora elynae]
MSLKLGIPTDDEFPTFVPMTFEAMGGRSEFVNVVWPRGFTKDGQELNTSRFLFLKNIDPSSRWIKVTDTQTNEIIGVAQWNVYDGQKPPEMIVDGPPGTWENDTEKEYAQELFKSYMQKRWAYIRENELPLVCLNIMTVAPKHQYRGAGTMMMQWGNELADSIGAACIVESTIEGRGLYEKSGYEIQEHWTLDVPGKFGDRPKQRLFFMIRPRKSGEP